MTQVDRFPPRARQKKELNVRMHDPLHFSKKELVTRWHSCLGELFFSYLVQSL